MSMNEITIKPCPKCGRIPKLKIKCHFSTGITCEIQCKPFLRKPHMCVKRTAKPHESVIFKTAKLWNDLADCANLPVW